VELLVSRLADRVAVVVGEAVTDALRKDPRWAERAVGGDVEDLDVAVV
jgi:hypothetical protein